MGQLIYATASTAGANTSSDKQATVLATEQSCEATIYDKEHLYCRFCFEDELVKENGLLHKVYKTSPNTSTGNWLNHSSINHYDKFKKCVT